MGTHPIFESDFDCLTDTETGYHATTNSRDQRIPLHRSTKGCLIRENKEEQGQQSSRSDVRSTFIHWLSMIQKKPTNCDFLSHQVSKSRISSERHKQHR